MVERKLEIKFRNSRNLIEFPIVEIIDATVDEKYFITLLTKQLFQMMYETFDNDFNFI